MSSKNKMKWKISFDRSALASLDYQKRILAFICQEKKFEINYSNMEFTEIETSSYQIKSETGFSCGNVNYLFDFRFLIECKNSIWQIPHASPVLIKIGSRNAIIKLFSTDEFYIANEIYQHILATFRKKLQ